MTRRISCVCGLLLFVGLVVANAWSQPGPQTAQNDIDASQNTPDENPDPQAGERDDEAMLLRIAREYRIWGRVDGQARVLAPRLGPRLLPARFSQAEEMTPHGQKLYFLFARNRDTYLLHGVSDPETGEVATILQPVNQVIVKEAWHPVEVDAEEARSPVRGLLQGTSPYAVRDGVTYRADELAGLFIMAKISDEALEGTDNGWIYGTVSTDGEVTSVGRVESCMACHQDADTDRIFGLKPL